MVKLGKTDGSLTWRGTRSPRFTYPSHAKHDYLFFDFQPIYIEGVGQVFSCEKTVRPYPEFVDDEGEDDGRRK